MPCRQDFFTCTNHCLTVTQYTRQLSSCLYLLPALLQNGLRLTMPKVLVPASASPPTVLELLALGISPRNPAAMTMTYRNMQKAEYKSEQIRAIVISMIEYGAPLPEWMKVRNRFTVVVGVCLCVLIMRRAEGDDKTRARCRRSRSSGRALPDTTADVDAPATCYV